MLKGLVLTPPVLGRIAIGKTVERNGKRLPEKDDQFTLTSQIQTREGWLLHPLDEVYRQAQDGKLRSLPVRLLFNDPQLNFRAEYCLFDRQTGRPLCVGDGEQCRRRSAEGLSQQVCPGPDVCSLAQGGACKPYGRLNVLLGDEDPLGTFIFRTTGYNSIRTLSARLYYFQALSGDQLSCLPLELRLRGKSSRQSHGSPIFYVDLTLRNGSSLEATLEAARQRAHERQHMGFDQVALEQAARRGFSQGSFEDPDEEHLPLLDEFYPETEISPETLPNNPAQTPLKSVSSAKSALPHPTLATQLKKRLESHHRALDEQSPHS